MPVSNPIPALPDSADRAPAHSNPSTQNLLVKNASVVFPVPLYTSSVCFLSILFFLGRLFRSCFFGLFFLPFCGFFLWSRFSRTSLRLVVRRTIIRFLRSRLLCRSFFFCLFLFGGFFGRSLLRCLFSRRRFFLLRLCRSFFFYRGFFFHGYFLCRLGKLDLDVITF